VAFEVLDGLGNGMEWQAGVDPRFDLGGQGLQPPGGKVGQVSAVESHRHAVKLKTAGPEIPRAR
jgi:hypothetical protein